MSGWQRKKKYKEGKISTRKEKEVHGRKKKETLWRRKIDGQWRRRKTRGEGIKIFGGKKKKYLEIEIIWSAEENKNEEGRGKAYLGEGKIVSNERRKDGKTSSRT